MKRPTALSEAKLFIAPPPKLQYFSFGYQMTIADQLWIRAIQDIDFCDVQLAENLCRGKSWLAQMLLTVTDLAPDYQVAYEVGGSALSVLVSDVDGASSLYQRGMVQFPTSFRLHYWAGTHALMEEKNTAKAADIYLKAAKILGKDGDWLYSLANRLYVDAGKKDVAFKLYQEMKKTGLEEGVLKRMREKLGLQSSEAGDAPETKESP